MIHKNTTYGNVENVTVIDFGNGTLSLTDGVNSEYMSILIKTIPKTEIGSVIGKETSSDDFMPEVAIVFRNVESFNVFCDYVKNVKKNFKNSHKKQ